MQLPPELLEEITGTLNIKWNPEEDQERNSGRIPIGRRAVLLRHNGQCNAVIRDISASGVSLIAFALIPAGEEFILCIPRLKGKVVAVKCSTIRCAESVTGGLVFIVGAAFKEVLRGRDPN